MSVYHSHTDEELLQLLKEGNTAAFEELYGRYWKRMFAMAFLRLERRDIAEDIVQDIFTSLWQKRETLNISMPEAWLAAAVKYRVITTINRRLSREIATAQVPDNICPDTTLDHRFLEQELAAEVGKLPPKCRLVFIYNHELGYSNREIAQAMEISEKAVEKHISIARKKLHPRLGNLFHFLFTNILFFL